MFIYHYTPLRTLFPAKILLDHHYCIFLVVFYIIILETAITKRNNPITASLTAPLGLLFYIFSPFSFT